MSLLTRCPACGTAFRVAPEQLKAQHGTVRCGRCAAVFNAFDSLSILPGAPDAQPQAGAPQPLPPAGETVAEVAETLPIPAQSDAPPAADESHGDEGSGALRPWDDFASVAPARGRLSRAWAAGSFLLLLALAAQASYLLRVEIAGALPQARPWLERACAGIGCTVPWPRNIEQWSIESSDLLADPVQPNRMTLTMLLRNRAAFRQELPALELTLTDTQDRAVARRVVAPAEYLPPGSGAGDGLGADAEVTVHLAMDTGELNAAGYRLFLFYP